VEPINTPRLRLEPLLPGHADALFDGLQEPQIYTFIDERPPASRASLAERYSRLAIRRSPDGNDLWLNWAIFLRETASYIGYVQATVYLDRTAEIAYAVFPVWWARGLATEAVGAMIGYLRDRHGVTKFMARVHPENHRSIALIKGLGFLKVARTSPDARDTGTVVDEIYRL
jgi:[ribosomal protein S5]-alanine N-acetyltransferase